MSETLDLNDLYYKMLRIPGGLKKKLPSATANSKCAAPCI